MLSAISILALVALGLAIVFGMMDIVNLAHGEFVTIGAFTLALLQRYAGTNSFWLALGVAPLIGAVAGLILERTVIRFLYRRTLDTLLATYAVSLIVQKLLEMTMGKHPQLVSSPLPNTIDIVGVPYPAYRLLTIAIAVIVVSTCLLVLTRTRFGADLRAVIQNRQMAEAVGINATRMNQIAFAGGAGLAALAGVLIAPYASVVAQMGVQFLTKAFLVVVVGGIGSVIGCIVGSSLVASSETLLNYFVDPSMASAIVLILAIVLVRFCPRGLVAGFGAGRSLAGKS